MLQHQLTRASPQVAGPVELGRTHALPSALHCSKVLPVRSVPSGGVCVPVGGCVAAVPEPLPVAGGSTPEGSVPVGGVNVGVVGNVVDGVVVAGVQFLVAAGAVVAGAVASGVAVAGAGAGAGGGSASSSCKAEGVPLMVAVTVPVPVVVQVLVFWSSFFASSPSTVSSPSSALAAVDARLAPAAPQPKDRDRP
jgi:hypothetical protein